MTLQDLLNARSLAGSKYQMAVDRLHETYVELAALDAALMSANVNPGYPDIKTFSPLVADIRPFDHPTYAPLRIPGDWRETIAKRRDALIAGFAGVARRRCECLAKRRNSTSIVWVVAARRSSRETSKPRLG